jgi:D-alanyl-lipoteichoic acid acyltransferase DltB (MBOAT superfamily)
MRWIGWILQSLPFVGLGITGTDQLVLNLLVLIFWYWVNWYYVPTDTQSTGTKSTDTKIGTFIAR